MSRKKVTPAQIRAMECIRDHGTPRSETIIGRSAHGGLAGTIGVLLRNKWAKQTKKGWKLTDEGRLQIFKISG